MTKDEAIEKIKKLLRMQRGGTPGEVENALRLAQEIADKHSVDLNGVDPDAEAQRPISHESIIHGARVQFECKYAALIVRAFFHVPVDRGLERRKAYVEEHFGKLDQASIEPNGDAEAAKWRGYLAGRQTEIRKGVNYEAQQGLLIGA